MFLIIPDLPHLDFLIFSFAWAQKNNKHPGNLFLENVSAPTQARSLLTGCPSKSEMTSSSNQEAI